VSGESHYFLGRRYLLDVEEDSTRAGVRLVGPTTMELRIRPGAHRDQRDSVLQRWYRRELRQLLPPLLQKWEPRLNKPVAEVRVRRMKTRWGSCNASDGRIWLNLELIKKPVACLEYVLVHEMVHLHERHHNDRFLGWMDRLLPQWRVRRDELNRAPLAHEEWTY
jgi:predicted metal-dependent hydrolase